MDLGGIQTFIMNTYRAIVKKGIQYDFLTFHSRKQFFEDEITELGGRMYKIPSRRDGWLKTRKALSEFFDKHKEYDVVHYHTSSLSFLAPLEIAQKKGVSIRIVHSHSTNAPGGRIHAVLHRINRKRVKTIATDFFACGTLAGRWMFSGSGCENKVKLINNGIDIAHYSFDPIIREKMRDQLGVKGCFVIGHVGRFSEVKNHHFLLRVFKEYLLSSGDEKARLLLIGDGALRTQIEDQAKKLSIFDKTVFLGARKDVAELLQAMDYLVMPSLYEGFPVTAIEAQAAGLPCVLSDSITGDAVIKENVQMLSLSLTPLIWAKAIAKNTPRLVDNTSLISAGYDMKQTVDSLYNVYSKGSTN